MDVSILVKVGGDALVKYIFGQVREPLDQKSHRSLPKRENLRCPRTLAPFLCILGDVFILESLSPVRTLQDCCYDFPDKMCDKFWVNNVLH